MELENHGTVEPRGEADLTAFSEEKTTAKNSDPTVLSFLKEVPVLIVTAVLVAWVVKSFIVQPFIIPSSSMEPTLYPGDRVLVNKFVYRIQPVRPGDVVVLVPPFDTKKDFIKRVVAVGGQTLEVKNGEVFVDGKALDEPHKIPLADSSNFGPLIIPKDNVFLMGDNRPNSYDSRFFGPLNKNTLIGKALVIYWPPNRLQVLR